MKPLHWIAGSLSDLRGFPTEVRREAGFSIQLAQEGKKAVNALPLVGFGGASVLEIRTDEDGCTYRIIYTVCFSKAVYVLHCFKKKSKTGIATPKKELRRIRARLKEAARHHRENYEEREGQTNVGAKKTPKGSR